MDRIWGTAGRRTPRARIELARGTGPRHGRGYFGEGWNDLNVDGRPSGLTATFELRRAEGGGVAVRLNGIRVM